MTKGLTLAIDSSLELELSVTQAICEVLDTPRSLAVWLLVENGEFQQLIDLAIDPCDYQDPQHFADDYLATSLLAKSENIPLEVDRKQVALQKFFESEDHCAKTNARLSPHSHPEFFWKAKRLIQKTLGPLTRKTLDSIERSFSFGPGATTGVRGTRSVPSDKYDEEIHLTHELIPYYRSILGATWWGVRKNPVIVEGSKFTTVPKNAKTDRGICIEPTLNIYGQKGIGAYIRRRLRHVLNVDLNDQGINQRLASRAHSWGLATIDLSAASDTVSWKLVMEILPWEWFELLETFRCSHTLVDGRYVELEKFSSMGNGYTFELESLIFAATALSIVPFHEHHLVSVYGDDIVVPQAYANDVISALEYLGFKVNTSKSFLAGNFFESCGTDWFCGHSVRPFFLRKSREHSDVPYTLQIANMLRMYSNMRLKGLACDRRFKPIWDALVRATPRVWRRALVPASFGDAGLISSFDEARPRSASSEGGIEGWKVQHVHVGPRRLRKKSVGRMLAALASLGNPEVLFTRGFEARRGLMGLPRTKWTTVSQWTKGLDWV